MRACQDILGRTYLGVFDCLSDALQALTANNDNPDRRKSKREDIAVFVERFKAYMTKLGGTDWSVFFVHNCEV